METILISFASIMVIFMFLYLLVVFVIGIINIFRFVKAVIDYFKDDLEKSMGVPEDYLVRPIEDSTLTSTAIPDMFRMEEALKRAEFKPSEEFWEKLKLLLIEDGKRFKAEEAESRKPPSNTVYGPVDD